MSFGEILKDLRAEKGVTQVEVAKGCGLTTTCICSLEQGTRNPTGSTVAVLATYFGVSADYLLGLVDDFGTHTAAPMGESSISYSSEERKLIEDYRELNTAGKKLVNETIKTLRATVAGSEPKKKEN